MTGDAGDDRPRVGIVGAGAIGIAFATRLARVCDVVVLLRDSPRAAELEMDDHLLVDGVAVAATLVREPRRLATADFLLVAVKRADTTRALAPLRGVIAPDAIVVSVQNGIEIAAPLIAAVGPHPVICAPTTLAATRLAPGRIRLVNVGLTTLGYAAGYGGPPAALERLAAALARAELPVRLESPIEAALWTKLVAGAAILPVTALAGVRNGAVRETPELRARAHAIAREVAAVAAALGFSIESPEARVDAVAAATAENESSMFSDLAAGRLTEAEPLLGPVVRAAATVGIPVPTLARALDEVRARETA